MAFTKEEYDDIKKRANEQGIKILTKYRKNLVNIAVEPIVLWEGNERNGKWHILENFT
jgi:hypothetical protein